jgi:hypothetical protein
MKNQVIFCFCAFFMLPFHSYSQFDEWSIAAPLTDSLTDNRNAIVMELDYFNGWDFYIFWEKSADASSSQIMAMSYYFQEEPIILTEGEHHHTSPCILKTGNWSNPPNNPSFYLFYLSDKDGDFDIYYRTYSPDGWSDEVAFTATDGDEKNLCSNAINNLAWEYDGSIIYSRLNNDKDRSFYFSDPAVVASGDCKNPVLEPIAYNYMSGFFAWEKVINDSSKVMVSEWDYGPGEWKTPLMADDTGHCTNLQFQESTFSEVAPTLSWDRLDANGHLKLLSYDPWYQDFWILDTDPLQAHSPSVFNIFMGVKDIWFYALLSFVVEENGQADIYGGFQGEWPYSYTNLSASSANDANPKLWNGIFYGEYQDVINIWESNRNGHWQLWTSKILVPIFGSVDEKNKETNSSLSIYPNPFHDLVTVSFHSKSAGTGKLLVFDHLGRNLGLPLGVSIKEGENSFSLNIDEITGRELPDGIYFITLEAGKEKIAGKIIKYSQVTK